MIHARGKARSSHVTGLVESSGGIEGILSTDRSGYFRYLQLVSQVYGVLKIATDADVKVSSCRDFWIAHRARQSETVGVRSDSIL
jgi:hypothetical protein